MDLSATSNAEHRPITKDSLRRAGGVLFGAAAFGGLGSIGHIINNRARGAGILAAGAGAGIATGASVENRTAGALGGMGTGATVAGTLAYRSPIPGGRDELAVIAGVAAMFGGVLGALGGIVVREDS